MQVPLQHVQGYMLSDTGELFRIYDSETPPHRVGFVGDDEYPWWPVWDHYRGMWTKRYCHREMAEHFIPNPNNYPVVNHKDGNKFNFQLSNLEWCTQRDNVIHAHRTGLTHATPVKVVQQIKKMLKEGYPLRRIVEITGVSYQTVHDIKQRKRHADVEPEE